MGFSVTASHVIILVTVIAGASALGATQASVTARVEEGERTAASLREDQVHTSLWLRADASYPSYNAVDDTYTVMLRNNGTTVLRLSEMEYLIDGVHATSQVASDDVDGNAATDLWMPGEWLTVVFSTVTSAPSRFAAYAENGVGAFHGA